MLQNPGIFCVSQCRLPCVTGLDFWLSPLAHPSEEESLLRVLRRSRICSQGHRLGRSRDLPFERFITWGSFPCLFGRTQAPGGYLLLYKSGKTGTCVPPERKGPSTTPLPSLPLVLLPVRRRACPSFRSRYLPPCPFGRTKVCGSLRSNRFAA